MSNGKNFKQCQVVLLSTNEKANALKGYKNRSLLFARKSSYHNEGELIERELAYFHLYITSDEEIKEGDWLFQHENNKIQQYLKGQISPSKIFKKIIATTDTSLGNYIKSDIVNNMGTRIISTKYTELPQPSPQFISKYIEEYNKGNIITNVLVEYEEKSQEERRIQSNGIDFKDILKLKVDSHNQITIKQVQPKLYTEEEVVLFAVKFADHCLLKATGNDFKSIGEMLKYSQENL